MCVRVFVNLVVSLLLPQHSAGSMRHLRSYRVALEMGPCSLHVAVV